MANTTANQIHGARVFPTLRRKHLLSGSTSTLALCLALSLAASLLNPIQTVAEDIVWTGDSDANFNDSVNWSIAGGAGSVPSSPDVAHFTGTTPNNNIVTTNYTSLRGINFNAGAADYQITLGFDSNVYGNVVNNSGIRQTIDANSSVLFFYGSSASGTHVEYKLSTGQILFRDVSVGGLSRFDLGGSGRIAILGSSDITLGSLTGAGAIENHSGAAKTITVGGLNESTTYSGVIGNVGELALNKTGTGTLVLTGTNTYTGGTTISGGTLQIGNGGTGGSIVGNITNNAALVFNRSNAITYDGVISGTGSLEVKNGTTILANNNGYSGGTTISGGTLQIGNGGSSGSLGTGAIVNNGTLVYNRDTSSPPIMSNEISGTGALDVVSGFFYMTGNNSYSGTTTIRSGAAIAIGYGTTTGSLGTGAVTNNGRIVANRTGDYVISNDISGAGIFDKSSSGTAILTGSNTYTGLTTINLGALQIGNGGTTGSIAGDISNSSSLIFNRSDGLTYSGSITGSGSVTVTNGVINLTGTNNYSGATHVNGGTLVVNGSNSASSLLTVSTGGTLGGSGTVGRTVVASGGTLSPGNSPGTLTVAGDLTLAAGSVFVAEVQGAIADRVNVTGTAALAGTLRLVPLGGAYEFTTPYTLLYAAGGITGTFVPVDTTGTFGAGVVSKVSYTGTEVLLALSPSLLTRFDSPENAAKVSTAIDLAVAGGSDPSSLFGVYNLAAADIAAGVNTLSGEIHTAVPAMAHVAYGQFLRTMLDTSVTGRIGTGAANAGGADGSLDELLYSIWGTAYGSTGQVGGNSAVGSSDRTIRDGHFAAGFDARIMPGVVTGIAVSGGGANASLPGVIGVVDASVFQAGVYGMAQAESIKLGGALSVSRLGNQVQRSIPALGSSLSSIYDTTAWSGRLEASAALLDWNGFTVSPLAALQATQASSPGVVEGGGAGALTLNGRNDLTSRTELGLQIEGSTILGEIPVSAQVRASWAHYLQPSAGLTASLVDLPGSEFTARGTEMDRNSVLLNLDLKAPLSQSTTLGLNLGGELSHNSTRLAGSVQFKGSF
jgi:autotransporter-associated beta strand protein